MKLAIQSAERISSKSSTYERELEMQRLAMTSLSNSEDRPSDSQIAKKDPKKKNDLVAPNVTANIRQRTKSGFQQDDSSRFSKLDLQNKISSQERLKNTAATKKISQHQLDSPKLLPVNEFSKDGQIKTLNCRAELEALKIDVKIQFQTKNQQVTEQATLYSLQKIGKFESRLHKLLLDLSERYMSSNYTKIEIILSELMSIIISAQESNLNYLGLIHSNLGRYFQAVLNVYSKLKNVPHAVIFYFPSLIGQFSEMGNMLKNILQNFREIVLKRYENFDEQFLQMIPGRIERAVCQAFEEESNRLVQNTLLRVENSDLLVSPTKLFDHSQLVITSEQKTKENFGDNLFGEKENSRQNVGWETEAQQDSNQRFSKNSSNTQITKMSQQYPENYEERFNLGKRDLSKKDPSSDSKKIESKIDFTKEIQPMDDQVMKELKTTFNQAVDRESSRQEVRDSGNKLSSYRLNIKKEANSTGTQSASKGSNYHLRRQTMVKNEPGEMPKIRKKVREMILAWLTRKVCRKLFQIFTEKFNLERNYSKQLALKFEQKIDEVFDHSFNETEYIKCLKRMVQHLESCDSDSGQREHEIKRIKQLRGQGFLEFMDNLNLPR